MLGSKQQQQQRVPVPKRGSEGNRWAARGRGVLGV